MSENPGNNSRSFKVSLAQAESIYAEYWKYRNKDLGPFNYDSERKLTLQDSLYVVGTSSEHGIVRRISIEIISLDTNNVQINTKIHGFGDQMIQNQLLNDSRADEFVSDYLSRVTELEKVQGKKRVECNQVPTKPDKKEQWRKIYKQWKKMNGEYGRDFADNIIRRAKPTIREFADRLTDIPLMNGHVPERKTIGKIIKAGDAGCLE